MLLFPRSAFLGQCRASTHVWWTDW